MEKAFIYSRQSSGDEDYSISIEVQKNNCRLLAENKGIEVIAEFEDLNSSGKLYPSGFDDLAEKDLTYKNWLKSTSTRKTSRVGLGNLFSRLGEVKYIIVDDYTRLARPLTGSFLDSFISQMMFTYDIKILTVKNGEIDLNSFNDALITTLQNRINDNQIAIQRKKAKDGLKRLLDTGVNKQGISKIPGFKYTGRKHELELIPEDAEAIKLIYQEFLSGTSINNIVRKLNANYPHLCKKEATKKVVRLALICRQTL